MLVFYLCGCDCPVPHLRNWHFLFNFLNMQYKEKAKILTQFFSMYGIGNFDLSLEEIAFIIELVETKNHPHYLEFNLKELYDRLSKTRLG